MPFIDHSLVSEIGKGFVMLINVLSLAKEFLKTLVSITLRSALETSTKFAAIRQSGP